MSKLPTLITISLALILSTTLSALTLKQSIQETIKNNPEIKAELKNQEAYKEYVDEKKGAFLPTLDFQTYYEKNEKTNSGQATTRNEGWNARLQFDQLLYNGGRAYSELDEMRATRIANRHRSKVNIETIVIKALNSYLGMVQYKELIVLSEDIIAINEKNLLTAKDKEEISGEILETYQVSSKLHFAQDKFLEQEDEYEKNKNAYLRYVGKRPESKMCRPQINQKNIPRTLQKAIEIAVVNSDKIKEAIAKISEQKAKLSSANASFLPTLKLQLESTWDNDLEITAGGRQDEYIAKLNLSWNLFNGTKDYNVSQREQKFLLEAKKDLDSITDEVVETIKTSYNKFAKNQKRVAILKMYAEDNGNIVEVYKKEFDAGTRTFVDILNAESEFYQANTSLVNREFSLFVDYYELLFNLSSLSETILKEDNVVCKDIKKVVKKDNVDDLDSLLDELLEETPEMQDIELAPIKSDVEIDGYFENDILSMNENNYIINLATIASTTNINNFVSEYNLDKTLFKVFIFGNDKQYKKVLYGNYKTAKAAKKALSRLNKKALENKPYINKVLVHQKLYKKFH